jgi:hypothetical protein
MEKKRKPINLNTIDVIQLRQKGLPVDKISSMLDIPVEQIEEHLDHMEQYKFQSGVF